MSRISQRYNDSSTTCDVSHRSHDIGKKCQLVLMRNDEQSVILAANGKPFKTQKDAADFMLFNRVRDYHVDHRMNQFQNADEQ